jgi:hypothetical protein
MFLRINIFTKDMQFEVIMALQLIKKINFYNFLSL